jgi:hypothetical protein
MTDDQKATYKRIKSRLGLQAARAFMTEKERRRTELMRQKVPDAQSRAFAETLAMPEFAVPADLPETAAVVAVATPAPASFVKSGEQRILEEQARRTALDQRLAESTAAWERFHLTPHSSDSLEKWLTWAIKAATQAHEPGIKEPLWQKVTDPPPDVTAIGFALSAFNERDKVLASLMKIKQGGDDDEIVPKERKRAAQLQGMLDEVDAEIAAKGDKAYA